MQRMADIVGAELDWRQPNPIQHRYELHADQALVATLTFRSDWGSLATAASADGCWTFKRVGFWERRATVRACGGHSDLGLFTPDTWKGGGTLTLADGRAFHLTTNTWQTRMDIFDDEQIPLASYASKGWFKIGAAMSIAPYALDRSELPWLTMFGWYLIVMMYNDVTSTSVVASAAPA